MLPLQLKRSKLPRKTIFIAKLFLFSASLHLIFFIVISLLQFLRSSEYIRLNTISDGASVVLVPLIKTITPEVQQSVTVPIKEITKKTAVTPPKQKQKKTIIQAKEQKKQTAQKKPAAQKVVPPVENKCKKQPEKKVETKKEVIKKTPLQIPNDTPKIVDTVTTTTTVQQVGHYDLALISVCNEIKAGIAKTWRRPTNIPSTEQCQVKVCVRSENERTVTIVKSSRALALDIMVKNFVMQYPFPRALWNTEIELIF